MEVPDNIQIIPEREYGGGRKKIIMRVDEHIHVQFLLKLKEDRLKQFGFLLNFINSYLNDDPTIRQWIDNHPELKGSRRTKRIRRAEDRLVKKEKEQFNLDNLNIDEIFDILEEEEIGDE